MLRTFVFLLVTIIFTSCDPCRGVECENGGVCNDGECLCQPFYNGESCQNYRLDDYVGVYYSTWECDNDQQNGSVYLDTKIQRGIMSAKEVEYDLYYDLAFENSNDFIIKPQQSGPYTIQGYGSVENNDLCMFVTYSSGGETFTCTFCTF